MGVYCGNGKENGNYYYYFGFRALSLLPLLRAWGGGHVDPKP